MKYIRENWKFMNTFDKYLLVKLPVVSKKMHSCGIKKGCHGDKNISMQCQQLPISSNKTTKD